jgi:hypothetical protein
MYSQLLPGLAAERGRDIRRDAAATSRVRRARRVRPGHRAGRAAAMTGHGARLMAGTARP